LFLAIFFISVGLLIDLRVVAEHWVLVLVGSALILTLKGAVVFFVLKALKLSGRPSLLAAAALSSTGEFTLVLIGKASGFRPLEPATEQMLLVCTAVTMAVVPTFMRSVPRISKWLEGKGLMSTRRSATDQSAPSGAIKKISDHAVICGYGPVGRALNEALTRCGVDTLVMEMNAETVRHLKAQGQAVLFADATHVEALDLAGIGRARLVAFTFPAVNATCAAVPLVRERNPDVLIFGRAKYHAEVERLRELGVRVIHDERETAVAMVQAAVSTYERNDIDAEQIVRDVVDERA
jgi:CPA2 family monovalent cation:H+ antiporter-2